MPLTLVLGPANSAKAGEVLGSYAAATHRGALLVVPNTQDVRHFARELAQEGSVLGSVLTFSGLCFEIALRAGYSARRLSVLQRETVVARSLQRAGLELLAEAAEQPGFVAAAGELISELERSLVTPQRFASAMGAWGEADERRARYGREVAGIYLSYARELERLRWVDGDLYAWRALDAMRAAPCRWGAAPVFLYGFDDLHPLQRDAVETLSSIVGVEVTVSLTYEAGRAALAARAEVVEELRPLADRVLELPGLDEHYSPDSRAALHHLERHLFEPARGENGASSEPREDRIAPGEAVRLLEAGGERAEAELLAAKAGELLRAGIPGEQIAIVYRSPAAVAPLLERVFRQYGVPLESDYELAFAHTTLGRAVLSLARCALLPDARASAEDLVAYVRTSGVLDQIEIADTLELAVRREGLKTAAQARARLPLPLAQIDTIRGAPDPAAELACQARRLLDVRARGRAGAPVLDGDGELDARALAAMLRALDELDELGELPSSGPELIDLLERLTVRAGWRGGPGAAVLTAPLAVRARRFHTVFVAGLQEGDFPRGVMPEPFLSQELRRELAVGSGLRLRLGEDGIQRERYLFYAAASRATHQLILSHRSSDEEGNIALPSPFLDDVAELLAPGWSERRGRRLLGDVVWPASEAPNERERALSFVEASTPPVDEPGSGTGALTEVALGLVRHREVVSGGALECYSDCPVKWLVERELRPKRLQPDPEPLARGSYVHEALEEVLRRLGGPVTRSTLPDALTILGQVVSELCPRIAPGSGEGVRRALLGGIEADLRRYLRHEAADGCDWHPAGLELRFGFEDERESLPALELGEDVLVRGAVDRVDVDPEGRRAIVRDYKSGSTRPFYQGSRWSADRRLQVALYMLAVQQLMGLEPAAGLYQPLGGSDLRPRGLFLDGAAVGSCLVANDARDEEALQAELEDASARAIEVATALRRGELAPTPQSCSRDGCAYPGICRNR